MEKKNTWETYSSKQLKELEKINAQYRDFLDNGKTERECIDTIVNTIEKSQLWITRYGNNLILF